MDDLDIDSFEARAAAAEKMIAEMTLAKGPSPSAEDVAHLKKMRESLVKAKAEHEALSTGYKQLLTERDKLEYRVEHLKKALREADAKLLNQNGQRPNPF